MRFILFTLILFGMIFLLASIRKGVRAGAGLTLGVILGGLGFVALLLLLLVVGGLF